MPAVEPKNLLLGFRTRDTEFGITRATLKTMATQFDLSETQVVHVALARMAQDELPAYEADDGPLTARDLAAVKKIAAKSMPTGKVLSKTSLF